MHNTNTSNAVPTTKLSPQALPPVIDPDAGAKGQDLNLQHPSILQSFLGQLDERFAGVTALKEQVVSFLDRFAVAPESLTPAEQAFGAHCRMTPADISQNLRYQLNNQTAFQTGFFALLRGLSAESGSPLLQERLREFLKQYDNLKSAPSLSRSIDKTLSWLESSLPRSFSTRLKEQTAKLTDANNFDAISENLELIKQQILPLLGEYAKITNERGPVRARISYLVHLLAQLNMASPEQVKKTFQSLILQMRYELRLPSEQVNMLEQLLEAQLENDRNPDENAYFDSLTAFLSREAKNPAKQPALLDLVSDASVFMPYFHAMLPFVHRETTVYCDVWAEKYPDDTDPDSFLLYLAFDIRLSGRFGLQIRSTTAGYGVEVYYPDNWQTHKNKLTQGIQEVFTKHNLSLAKVTCTVGEGPSIRQLIRRKAAERRLGFHAKI